MTVLKKPTAPFISGSVSSRTIISGPVIRCFSYPDFRRASAAAAADSKSKARQYPSKHLVLSLNNRQLDASYFNLFDDWVVEHDIFESNYWVSTRSLFSVLLPGNKPKFELLAGLTPPSSNPYNTCLKMALMITSARYYRKPLQQKITSWSRARPAPVKPPPSLPTW